MQHYFKINSKVRCQLFLGERLGKCKRREGGPRARGQGGALISWEGGPVAGRSCCEEQANKGPSGRKKGKDEHRGNVILKCFDSSGVFAP